MTRIAALLLATLIASAAVAQPTSMTGQPTWSFSMQTNEYFGVSIDFANYLTTGAHIESIVGTVVTVIHPPRGTPTPPPTTGIVETTSIAGTKLILNIDGSKTVSGASYQISATVTGSDGRIVSWPVRLDAWNVQYRQ